MTLEEQAAYIQSLKAEAGLDQQNPKERLLSELADTVSLLCHQVSLLSEVSDGMNDSLAGWRFSARPRRHSGCKQGGCVPWQAPVIR